MAVALFWFSELWLESSLTDLAITKGFFDLSKRDQRYVVQGAVFLVGLFVLVAFLLISSWDRK